MRLKEIKPGMVVHCKTLDEMKQLIEFCNIDIIPSMIWNYKSLGQGVDEKTDCLRFDENGNYYGNGRRVFYEDGNYTITEFSDLVLHDMTAEETIKLHTEVCCSSCKECPLYNVDGYSDCEDLCINNPEKAVEILAQWKSEHEKKEPEIETVDICRIIEIQPDGKKRCVHEEDISDGELMYSGDAVENCRYILKNYCKEHDGEFIAVHEVVSRVKAV